MKYQYILVDGMNLIHRAAHGGKDLTTSHPDTGKTIPIGAVFQFIRSACILWDEYAARGATMIIAWEGDRETSWRRDLFPAYKNRERNEDIEIQVEVLRDLLTVCGWSQVWSPTHEADDTLATLSRILEERGDDPIAIVTSDQDLHQCVTKQTHIIDPNGYRHDLTNNAWKLRDVRHHWGFDPDRIPDIKALMGDSSDNVPGATGIGKLWATGLIRSYGSLEGVLDIAAEYDEIIAKMEDGTLKKSKVTKKSLGKVGALRERDRILMFRRIVTTVIDAEMEFAPRRYNANGVIDRFKALKFGSLLAPSTLRTIGQIAK